MKKLGRDIFSAPSNFATLATDKGSQQQQVRHKIYPDNHATYIHYCMGSSSVKMTRKTVTTEINIELKPWQLLLTRMENRASWYKTIKKKSRGRY